MSARFTREYWMVQYRKANGPWSFQFRETRADAERAVAELRKVDYLASCWEL